MAIDQAMLDRAEAEGESWLRLYQWEPHCLSFGRHEPATRRYDRSRISALGLDVVRRPSGGRAVWHAREVTYALAAPTRRFGGLREAYLAIHQMLAAALRRMGVAAELAEPGRPVPLDAGACFARAAGGEVMVNKRKIVGSAQMRQRSALLQHGSILLEDDQAVVRRVLRGEPAEGDQPTGPLSGLGVPADDLIASIIDAAASAWDGGWREAPPADGLLEQAARHYPRFRSGEWTWRA
jgi:lipoate-protein ligase A